MNDIDDICTCAVSVKSGDDVIVIDRCGAELDAEHSVIEVKMYVTNQAFISNDKYTQHFSSRSKEHHSTVDFYLDYELYL
jgi:hypothetical protein